MVEHITMAWGLAISLDEDNHHHNANRINTNNNDSKIFKNNNDKSEVVRGIYQRKSDKDARKESVEKRIGIDCDPATNHNLFEIFLESVFSGLNYKSDMNDFDDNKTATDNENSNSNNTTKSNEKSTTNNKNDRDSTWSLHQQCMMACISVICTLYHEREMEVEKSSTSEKVKNDCNHFDNKTSKSNDGITRDNLNNINPNNICNINNYNSDEINDKNKDNNDSHFIGNNNTDNKNKTNKTNNSIHKPLNSFTKAYRLLEIIARLPANTHAITKVNSSSSKQNQTEITQKRIGFGLFLSASAVNHSCRPNCTIRYKIYVYARVYLYICLFICP